MRSEYSCGIIPLRRNNDGEWETLLIFSAKSRYWGFPKGHAEGEETHQEAAMRELYEETGLQVVRFLSPKMFEEQYHCFRDDVEIFKQVFFFIAEVTGDIVLQQIEVADSQWVPLSKAHSAVTYETDKDLCRRAASLIASMDKSKSYRLQAS